MILRAFSVYDSKTEVYGLPWFINTTDAGIRMFADAVNDERSPYNKHPGDFSLFEIGLFDDAKGIMIENNAHVNHGSAIQYKKKTLEVLEK